MELPRIKSLFPVPLCVYGKFLQDPLLSELKARVADDCTITNSNCESLRHTRIYGLADWKYFSELVEPVTEALSLFGEVLFGETLEWSVGGIWGNVLEKGGFQASHNHPNSIASGIIYLDDLPKNATTKFHKVPSGSHFTFDNHHPAVAYTNFNGPIWSLSSVATGDMVIFPSYLFHEVRKSEVERRCSIAFNAVPTALNNSGYVVTFGA